MRLWTLLLAAGLAGEVAANAQTAALLPPPVSYFTDANGYPLAGGLVYSCVSGSACPGTPLATYTDSTAGTANSNPVVLNASGRANIWLTNVPYKIVVKTSAGVTISTTDNVAAGGFANSGPWQNSGTTIYNNPSTGNKVCIGSTACTTSLALLNIVGTSSGSSYLVRIDDAGNSPGINLYGGGNSYGAVTADSAGLRLRAGSGASQVQVAQGAVTVQDSSTGGATSLIVKAGDTQGAAYPLQIQSSAGTALAWADSLGRWLSPMYNAIVPTTKTDLTFKNSDDTFAVNGQGDITGNGSLNMVGANGVAPYKVNGVDIVDSAGNATFTTLTCTGTPCGSGGGGGGSFPVSDATTLFYNAGTPSKLAKFDFQYLTAATTRTYVWPDADITVLGAENNQIITGQKTFSAAVVANAGVGSTVFNATNTGTNTTFQNSNSKFLVDWAGNLTASGAMNVTGYVTSLEWLGLKKDTSTPGTTPGGGNSAINYKGGTSGLEIWLYDTVHGAWSAVDLGAAAGSGITSLNGQTGAAQTIAGNDADQIIVTIPSSNTINIATPQNIGLTSNVQFGNVLAGATGTAGAIAAYGAANTTAVFQVNKIGGGTPFSVDGLGDISSQGQINLAGGGAANLFKIGGTTVIDNNRNAFVVNLTVTGTCTGCGGTTGSYLPISGGTMTGSILSAGANLGSGTNPFSTGYFSGPVLTTNLKLIYGPPSAPWDFFSWTAGTHRMDLQDSVGNPLYSIFEMSGYASLRHAFYGAVAAQTYQNWAGATIIDSGGNYGGASGVNVNVNTGSGSVTTYGLNWYGGSVVIDSGRNATLSSVTTSGLITANSAIVANGGVSTLAGTNSQIHIGYGGNFWNRLISGAPSCAGIVDGWMGYDTAGDVLYICNGGVARVH